MRSFTQQEIENAAKCYVETTSKIFENSLFESYKKSNNKESHKINKDGSHSDCRERLIKKYRKSCD